MLISQMKGFFQNLQYSFLEEPKFFQLVLK